MAQFQPDGGITRFFYDKLGRLIASQDALQAGNGRYSYTLYDDLGRVTEVGQLVSPEPLDQEIARDEGEAPIATWADFLAQITAREQITRTYYTTPLEELDIDLAGVTGSFGTAGQQHLRNRVVATTFLEQPSNPGQEPPVDEYDQATHYSYDIHGNVRSLVQEIGELHQVGQGFKRMDYRYDLVSGKVLEVNYQHGQWDQFHHRYRYDADGRLLEARTSSDGRIWERDARYLYYAHGPLARTELGDKQVQGTDHYYTLQGWLRGVNTPTLDRTLDPGTDGVAPGHNGFFGEDANSYALAYYTGDFNPVGGNTTMLPDEGTGDYADFMNILSLHNGNIPSMLTALRDPDGLPMPLHLNLFAYDRLNRIKASIVADVPVPTDLGTSTGDGDYGAGYSYDPNGNLLNLKRNAHGTNQAMDDLSYSYLPGTNKLDHVHDAVDDAEWPDDLDEQDPENYAYDAKGRLVRDLQVGLGGVTGIQWTLHDKVRLIKRVPGNTMPDLHFRYGATGQRTIKEVRPRDGSGDPFNEANWTTTYYIHDAQGNPMAIYQRNYGTTSGTEYTDYLYANGLPVYGSSRLGLERRKRVYSTEFTTTGFGGDLYFIDRDYTTMPSPWADDMEARRELGFKQYELANHLGNVLTTVSDRKLAVPDAGSPDQVDYYTADILSVNDYYPFGLLKPGRNFNSGSSRYLFQGQEHDDELHGATGTSYNYEYRMHDPRIGRFLSIDPLAADYPWNSSYAFSENRVIDGIDFQGLAWNPFFRLIDRVGPMLQRGWIYARTAIPWISSRPDIAIRTVEFSWGLMLDEPYPGPSVTTGLGQLASKAWVKATPGFSGAIGRALSEVKKYAQALRDELPTKQVEGIVNGLKGKLFELEAAASMRGVIAVNKNVVDDLGRFAPQEIDLIRSSHEYSSSANLELIFTQVKDEDYSDYGVGSFLRRNGNQLIRTMQHAIANEARVEYVFREGKVSDDVLTYLRGLGVEIVLAKGVKSQ